MPKSKTTRANHRSRTTFEQLPTEIFFEFLDYLTGNQIYKSFFALNQRFKELVHNTPNVHLDLSTMKTKLFRSFPRIFRMENLVSIVLASSKINLLETLFQSTSRTKIRSLTLLNIPLRMFETRLPELLSHYRHQLIKLEIHFSDMKYAGTGAKAGQSFGYLLTDFPLLKHLNLEYPGGIDCITYMASSIINNTIVHLDISLYDLKRLIPLLHRFGKLKFLSIHYNCILTKRAMPSDPILTYRSQLGEKIFVDYPIKICHLHFYTNRSILENLEQLFQILQPSNLLTFKLITTKPSVQRTSINRRQILSLDGKQVCHFIERYLPSTIKQFSLQYEDIDESLSMITIERIRKELRTLNRLSHPDSVLSSFDNDQKHLFFNLFFL